MGCGQSNFATDDRIEFILVGGSQSMSGHISHFSDVEIHSLNVRGGREKHRLLPLPSYTFNDGGTRVLSHCFSSAFDAEKSLVYLTGGCYGEDDMPTNHFWQLNTKTDSEIITEAQIKYGSTIPIDAIQYIKRLPNLPKPIKNHKSCFSRYQDSDFLYVVGNGDSVYRFNFAKYCWTTLPPMPIRFDEVSSVLAIDHYLYVLGSGALLTLNLASGQWIIKCEVRFPCGNAVVSGSLIFIHEYDFPNSFIYVYNCANGKLFKYMQVEECDVTLKSGMAQLGPESIYFCGGFDEELKRSTNSIIQLGVPVKRTYVAGFIERPRENHSLFIRRNKTNLFV